MVSVFDLSSTDAMSNDALHQMQVVMVIAAATLGMYLWDICTNLKDDFRLLLTCKHHPFPTFIYFVARGHAHRHIVDNSKCVLAKRKSLYEI
ncbi:hypothetical protein K435DRAFT_860758 [Dendrothele bispora CBS 962.96]|uniref:Uncharacterized protein n=1 Tax=Dendrothele bispora (strain CBS 962.96) TaxID=1314807 RepID=A0A4S8LXP0_DENBC|nr:hypothetical protein K435DRAFT_860758 [Dendrothele bispora CBS 962.96]